jgi:hypothetical protein
MGLSRDCIAFSAIPSINPATGTAAVAYIPLMQGGDIAIPSGKTELFSIKLVSKAANPSAPTGTGVVTLTGGTTAPSITSEEKNEQITVRPNILSVFLTWIIGLFGK